MNLVNEIKEYYANRALKHPNIWEALGWVTAELGEVYEVLFSMNPGWVRNNPQDHPVKTKRDLEEELGDIIFMVVVAGIEEGLDPIQALRNKMRRKLGLTEIVEIKEENSLYPIGDGVAEWWLEYQAQVEKNKTIQEP